MPSVQEHSYYTVMWTAAPTDEAVTAAAAAAAVAERRAAILLARSCAAACQQQGLRTKLVPSMPEPTNFMAVFDVSERHSRARSIEYHPHLIFGFGCSPIRTPCGCGCFGCRCIGSSSGILHHKQLASSTLSTQISGRSHEQEGANSRSKLFNHAVHTTLITGLERALYAPQTLVLPSPPQLWLQAYGES
jgi:hypothetical protein